MFTSGLSAVQSLCENETIIVFFNGIGNTKSEAERSKEILQRFYGDAAPNGETLRYELLYNETLGMFDDILETFEQRISEQRVELREAVKHRYEYFMAFVNGDSVWYKKLAGAVPAYASFAAAFWEDVFASANRRMLHLISSAPTQIEYAAPTKRV